MKLADIQIKNELRYLLLYGLIGFCGASLDFLVYWFLTQQEVFYQYANFVSVTCGIVLNFFLNAKFNFNGSVLNLVGLSPAAEAWFPARSIE